MALRAAEGRSARASALTGGRRARRNAAEGRRRHVGTRIGAHRRETGAEGCRRGPQKACRHAHRRSQDGDGREGMALRAAEGMLARASALTGGRRARRDGTEGRRRQVGTRVCQQFPGYFPRPTAGSSKERLSSPVVRITLRGIEPIKSAPQSARRRPGWSEAISVGREPRGMLRGQSTRQLLRLSSPVVRITLRGIKNSLHF